jgi:catechol 2,3-dioxygenase-like lactoylglutathione lyase family enzyme
MKPGYAILFTADLAKLTSFYRDIVGLPLLWQQDGLVRFDGLMLHDAKPAWSDGTERQDTTWKPVFLDDDPAAVHARLAAAGVRVRAVQTFDERTGFDAVDPDGNIFRIANK